MYVCVVFALSHIYDASCACEQAHVWVCVYVCVSASEQVLLECLPHDVGA